MWLTQVVFYGLPWLQWGARQAVQFDLEARRFYVFGLVLYPQDFIYLTALLVISALALFLFTAVAGRLWCGFACPQTVYTELFVWIERRVEGDRGARLRLDAAPWTAAKAGRKALKHGLWLLLALWTGYTFVGYFEPVRALGAQLLTGTARAWTMFWVLFYALATYGNAGFLREQVCKYMCPYARFQGAMFDKGTLIVSYDTQRGEPRGSRPRGADGQARGLGSCTDCTLCVQVCPVGIDIRKGLQYECISCGLCIDACDGIMKKMRYATGLIRFTTQAALAGGMAGSGLRNGLLRPRVMAYLTLLLALVAALASALALRMPLKVDVVRDRSVLARQVSGGAVENVYRLQVMNATESRQRYRIVAEGLPGLHVASEQEFEVGPVESRWVGVRVQLPVDVIAAGSHPMKFVVSTAQADSGVTEKSVFLVPR